MKASEAFTAFKETYTTPPFKSYKSKIPTKENNRIQTTSYRSRSKAYDDSTQSSLNMKSRKSKEISKDDMFNTNHYKNHYPERRELNYIK
jgi:hypothetical protein